MGNFIFVRHGQSQANAAKKIATAKTPLTDEGIKQAEKIARELKSFKIDMIASSPMLRAKQTAEIIAGVLGVEPSNIKVIEELRERGFGKLEGGPKTHDSKWYLEANNKNLEPRKDLVKRMKKALAEIAKLAESAKNVLVTGHDVSGNYLIQAAKGKDKFKEFESLEPLPHEDFIKVKI